MNSLLYNISMKLYREGNTEVILLISIIKINIDNLENYEIKKFNN